MRVANEDIEALRRDRAAELNRNAGARQQLLARHGQVWDAEELAREFEVIGFAAPYVVVRRKTDRQNGGASNSNTIPASISTLSWTTRCSC